MKHLILVRHAKSSWKDSDLEDHERPLGKRGKRDAPYMAKIFRDKKIDVDLIVSSTAKHASKTAITFAKKLDYKKDKILREPELYLAEAEGLLDYMRTVDDDNKTVMLFGIIRASQLLQTFLPMGTSKIFQPAELQPLILM